MKIDLENMSPDEEKTLVVAAMKLLRKRRKKYDPEVSRANAANSGRKPLDIRPLLNLLHEAAPFGLPAAELKLKLPSEWRSAMRQGKISTRVVDGVNHAFPFEP